MDVYINKIKYGVFGHPCHSGSPLNYIQVQVVIPPAGTLKKSAASLVVVDDAGFVQVKGVELALHVLQVDG